MKDYKGKKLLVLGGASQHCKVVEAAHRLGAIVYVADYLKEAPAKKIADKDFLIDVFDIEGLKNLCIQEKIDGAISTSLDACSLPYQQLCEIMNFPCFGSKEQFSILMNKINFKKCCSQYGVDTIPEYSEKDFVDDCEIEYPVFIKPANGSGSKGQSICYSKGKALMAIDQAKKYSSTDSVVIEKYMQNCQDFTAAYLVKDGIPVLVRTGDRFEGEKNSDINNLCIASASPSKYTDFYLKNVHHNVVEMIKGIGLINAPVFFQGFIDGNKIRFYDPGLRFAGGEYERLLKIATGKDIIQMLVEFALSGNASSEMIDDSICLMNGKKSIQLDPTLSPGRIKEIGGLEEIQNNQDVISIARRYYPGDVVPGTHDVKRRFAEFALLSENLDKEIENINFIQEKLKVVNDEEKSMIIQPFNTELLK